MGEDANVSTNSNHSLFDTWYKLLGVQHVTENQMKWPAERDFIRADTLILVASAANEGRLIVDGRYYPMRPGTVFVCRPGQLLEMGLHVGDEHGFYLLRFQAVEMPSAGHKATVKRGHKFPGESEAVQLSAFSVIPLCKSIFTHWNSGSMADRFRSESGFYELLSQVFKNQEHKTELALECAKLMIEQHYTEDMTIDRLATTAGLSRYHFMRLFKEKFGKGVMEYVTDLRLNEARRLMGEQGKLSLTDIAYKVGYKNETYFSNMFKKHIGLAPAVYMKNRSVKIAAYSWVNIGQLLALHTIPYAAPIDQYWTDYYRNKYAFDVSVPLSHHYEFNREALQKAQPDYIIGIDAWIEKDEQVRLEQIAPSLFLPWEEGWRRHLMLTADFLGKSKDAAKWLHRYDQKAVEIRGKVKKRLQDETVILVVIDKQTLHIWGRHAGTVLYDDLQLAPACQINTIFWTQAIEVQDLGTYEADHILLSVPKDEISQATWHRMSRSQAWQELKAVKTKQIHMIAGYTGLQAPWNEYNAFCHDRFLDYLSKLLEIKV
ncbi:AraC family transcriptional regulator [Paenibacillus sp. P36]|uniref:AraC family transcriptional regulator n=1 Tax=Paenibacillus sp. P36 TaxID=3342538 RepID=UPI0038B39D21